MNSRTKAADQLTLTYAGVGTGEEGISSRRPTPLSILITFEWSKISPVLRSCLTDIITILKGEKQQKQDGKKKEKEK